MVIGGQQVTLQPRSSDWPWSPTSPQDWPISSSTLSINRSSNWRRARWSGSRRCCVGSIRHVVL